jgi:hypothetical protein
MRTLAVTLALAVCAAAATTSSETAVTFNKQVLPILQKRCQDCHRPGEVAPMSLLTYKDARPWAKAMRQAVLTKKMPPWFADPAYGHFANDRSLSQAEVDTIVNWVDGGAKEGDAKDAPPPRQFVEGWNIGKPDLVLQMPNAFHVPASGVIEYQYVILPTGLKEDKWILASEVRPNRGVMHHVITSIREPGSKWMADMQPGVVFVPPKGSRAGQLDGGLSGYVPGQALPPPGSPRRATLLKAGSDIVFQLHYTPNGTPVDDQTKIGIIFAKEPPNERLMGGNSAAYRFSIPPGADNFEVDGTSTVAYDSYLYSMMPHAHLRGKSFEYRIVRPDGTSETVLKVPKYDFHWQLTYYLEKPIFMPKGTKVEVTAHFDNSVNNPNNPDATKEIHWGEQTFEEMMMGYFSVVVDPKNAPEPNGRRRQASVQSELPSARLTAAQQ